MDSADISKSLEDAETPEVLLDDPEQLHQVTLINKISVNHDTKVFRFALPSPQQTLGVPVGQHVGLSARVKDEDVLHWYTPLSCDRGTLELLIKVYYPCDEFPAGGRLTQHLERMREGEAIDVRGPRGKLRYLGRGQFLIQDDKSAPPRTVQVRRVNMVAGGSGVAPMLQLLRAKARDPDDHMETAFVFANQSEQDIMMRGELEEMRARKVLSKLWLTVDRPAEGWQFGSGHVTSDMLRTHLFGASADTLTLMCGRKAMVRGLVRPLLLGLGHDDGLIFKY